MADLEHFEFKVPGYTPDTMPLDRLMEYLEQLTIILGQPSDLHLVGIKKSSTMPVLAMRRDVARKARARAREVWEGGGSERRKTAFRTIQRMVSEDGGEPAVLKANDKKIIEFPSVDLHLDQEISTLRQSTSLSGELKRIGGIGEHAQLLIQEPTGQLIVGCYASHEIARQIASLIYKPIRVGGVGSWQRTAEGIWQLNRLQVQTYEELSADSLEDVVDQLRRAAPPWPEGADDDLRALREDAA